MPNNTILDEVYAATLAHIAALEADIRTDYILAWDYGLGVKFEGRRIVAVRLTEATSVKRGAGALKNQVITDANAVYSGAILNGADVCTSYVRRDKAIAAYLPTLRQNAAQIKASIDQHHAAIAEVLPKQVVSAA